MDDNSAYLPQIVPILNFKIGHTRHGQYFTNTNVYYSLYYNLVNAIAEYCSNHPSIASVGNEELSDFDEREFPSYPVANIVIKQAVFNQNTTDWEVYILIADKYKISYYKPTIYPSCSHPSLSKQ